MNRRRTFAQRADVHRELDVRKSDVDRIVFRQVHEHHSGSGGHWNAGELFAFLGATDERSGRLGRGFWFSGGGGGDDVVSFTRSSVRTLYKPASKHKRNNKKTLRTH